MQSVIPLDVRNEILADVPITPNQWNTTHTFRVNRKGYFSTGYMMMYDQETDKSIFLNHTYDVRKFLTFREKVKLLVLKIIHNLL